MAEHGPESVTEGEVPFAVLDDGRVVQARFRTTVTPRPPSDLSDAETTTWSLALDGRAFTVVGDREPAWLPIGAAWARGERSPLPVQRVDDRHVVRDDFFYAHHLGWLSGPVTFTIDVGSMTVTVEPDLRFEAD